MGVVSNGMLCSGDELDLTADARRHPDPAARGAARSRARRPVRRRRARRRRQAEPRRCPEPRRPRPRGLGGDRRARPLPGRPSRSRPARRSRSACASRSRSRRCAPRFVGRWVGGVTVGPSPDLVQMRLHRGRPATGQQRRRRQQLRDARARQADPHVRRGRGPRRPDRRPPRPRGRAARDARPRRARADARHPAHRRSRRVRSASPA